MREEDNDFDEDDSEPFEPLYAWQCSCGARPGFGQSKTAAQGSAYQHRQATPPRREDHLVSIYRKCEVAFK